MEIAVVGAAARSSSPRTARSRRAGSRSPRSRPTIIRAPGAEAAIAGRLPAPQALAAVAEAAAAAARPIGDLRASEAYRRHTVGVVARRAVEIAARRAGGEAIPVPANRARGIGAPPRRCRMSEITLTVNGIAVSRRASPRTARSSPCSAASSA